jgi:hypothetical protein
MDELTGLAILAAARVLDNDDSVSSLIAEIPDRTVPNCLFWGRQKGIAKKTLLLYNVSIPFRWKSKVFHKC